MTTGDVQTTLGEILRSGRESEWVEFKHNSIHHKKIGEYISAIANSAALHSHEAGYIIWGIEDATLKVIGTDFKPRQVKVGNEELESWLHQRLSPKIEFSIHEFGYEEHRLVMFIIQATRHAPVSFENVEYIRLGSYKKKLQDCSGKREGLWRMLLEQNKDWSSKSISAATVEDLDPAALRFAREQYKEKNPKKQDEIDEWEDLTFLNKAKLCIRGKITNTALILLGKEESEHLLTDGAGAEITWVLKDENDSEKDYQHFHPPFILAVNEVFNRIRNLTYRHLPSNSLFVWEETQYDPWVVRETLHNCIAHQDYCLTGRINIVEKSDSLLFVNSGRFIPGSIENVILGDAPPDQYRNRFLAQAMVNLNMIDTIGSGVKRIFKIQRERFFPMPDYDLSSD